MSRRDSAVLVFLIYLFSSSFTARSQGQGEKNIVVGPSYIAAVYEHRVILNPEPHVSLSRDAALEHLKKNLDIYEAQAARAAEQVMLFNVLLYWLVWLAY